MTQQFADAATAYSQCMATANQKLSDASTAATSALNGATTSANAALSAALAQAADVSAGTTVSGVSLPLLPALPDNERLGEVRFQRHGEDDGPAYSTVFSFFPKRAQNQGSQGDLGYYLKLVNQIQLNHVDTNAEDGYSNGFARLLGEGLIRPLVGDAILVTASDSQLLYGTAAFVVFAAGLAVCPGPALVGFAMSGGQNALGQYITTGTVDFHQVFVAGIIGGAAGVGGAVGGLVLGRVATGATQLVTKVFSANAATNVCKTATFLVHTGMKINQVSQTVNTAVAIANGDVNAAAGLAFSFGMGRFSKGLSFCFVYETPVAVGWEPIGEMAAMPAISPDENEASSVIWVIGSIGCFGIVALVSERKKRLEQIEACFTNPKVLDVIQMPEEPVIMPKTLSRSDGCDEAVTQSGALPQLRDESPESFFGVQPPPAVHPVASRRRSSSRAMSVLASVMLLLVCLCGWKALPSLSSALSPKAAIAAAAPTRPPTRKLQTVPIGELPLGRRVIANNPELSRAEATPLEIDPATWRAISLEMTKPDGHKLWIELLRSLEWVDESGAIVGESIDLDLAELGAEGKAEVLSIAACPDIEPDDGTGRRIITGRFRHESAEVVDVSLSNSESIGTTASHRWWTEDRQAYVPASDLRSGEHLRSLAGAAAIVMNIARRSTTEIVYNLEVETEHVYFVGQDGLLVHNAYAKLPVMTNKQAEEAAKLLGYSKINYRSAGKPVFSNGKAFITVDRTRHLPNGVWKKANSVENLKNKTTREGTFDADLNWIGD